MDAHAQAGNGGITGRDAGDPPAASDARRREGGRDHPDWEEAERAFALLTNSPDPGNNGRHVLVLLLFDYA